MKLPASVFLWLLTCSSCVIRVDPNDFADCSFTEERNAEMNLRGAGRIRISSSAGTLMIQPSGQDSTVTVNGMACARTHEDLQKVMLFSNTTGNELIIRAEVPPGAELDLIVSVPDSLPLEIIDRSGNVSVVNLVNDLYIDQGSGTLAIGEIQGSLRLKDGSGNLVVNGVSGEVVIDIDGSGDIRVERVGGSVIIHEDGSGSIDVRHVMGDFILERDGSGSVFFDDIHGRVVLP